MTEPTWKDELLQRWWEGCSEETKANGYLVKNLAIDPGRLTAASLLAFWFPCLFAEQADADRLRSLIDAELARGREAVEVLRENEWEGKSLNGGYPACPECGGLYPNPGDHAPPSWAGKLGHAPDCRLAKVIGGKP